jgi:hypothetical protein
LMVLEYCVHKKMPSFWKQPVDLSGGELKKAGIFLASIDLFNSIVREPVNHICKRLI